MGRSREDIVATLLERHGGTFADELGISLDDPTPSPLFRLLVAAILFSARIRTDIAVAAAKALFDQGWTTPDDLADSTWSQRAKVLNESGYARYDERTAATLGERPGTLTSGGRATCATSGKKPTENRSVYATC